jgi:hypothetical protein
MPSPAATTTRVSSDNGGAAHAAPPSQRRRKQGEATVRGRPSSVAHHVDVLNWARPLIRAGFTSKEIVALSKTTSDWPLPGQVLSDGTLAACYAAIHHLEAQGARFPLEGEGGLRKEKVSETKRRSYSVRKLRAEARRNAAPGDPLLFWETALEVSKASSALEIIEVEDLELTEQGLQYLDDLHSDLLRLQIFQDRVMGAVQVRLGEQKLIAKIRALRAKTIENGCTAEEAAMAKMMADRMERKLSAVLTT